VNVGSELGVNTWQARMMKDIDFNALEKTTDGWNWKPSA
jgi:hypothetical protein